MKSVLGHILPLLRLTRVATAFAVVGNAWFVVLWTRANAQEPAHGALNSVALWLVLVGATANGLGLFGYAMCQNDILDLKRDRRLKPGRPLASGAASRDTAIALSTWCLLAAVLGATVFGTVSVLLTLLLAGAILALNGIARFIPALGLVAYGLIYAGQMIVPNPRLAFVWPVWLVMTHMTVLTGVTHALERKVPPISTRAWVLAAGGWAFWSVVLLWVGTHRDRLWPDWVTAWAAFWPAVVMVLMVAASTRKVRLIGRGQRAAEKIGRYGTLAMSCYGSAWMFGAGDTLDAGLLAALALAGYAGMTVLREAYHLIENPVGYRR